MFAQPGQTTRYLTREEIQWIVKDIPSVKAATAEASKVATDQIKSVLSYQLMEIKIKPDKIPHLKVSIHNAYLRSLIQPGNPAGIESSEGVGGPATQMTLNTFHTTGSSSNDGSGIDTLRELLNMSQKRSVENATLHFVDKNLTFENVLELRREIVGVTVKDLLRESPKIMKTTTTVDGPDGRRYEQFVPFEQRGWWYLPYIKMVGINGIDSGFYLRISINRDRMFAFNITAHDIAKTLESGNSILKCVVSPSINSQVIIDAYIDSKRATGDSLNAFVGKKKLPDKIDVHTRDLFILKYIVAQSLDSFIIKGIPGISQIFPETIRTLSVIRSTIHRWRADEIEALVQAGQGTKEDLENTWSMWIDKLKMKHTGIPVSKVEQLLRLTNVTIIEMPKIEEHNPYSIRPKAWTEPVIEPQRFIVLMRGTGIDGKPLEGRQPDKYINGLLDTEDEKMRKRIKEQLNVDENETIEEDSVSELSRYGTYCYAKSNGANLKNILSHPLIDSTRSITNNPNDIYATIGIQAAYSFIVEEFYRIITGSSAYCTPRHITTLASFMTNTTPMSITSRAVSRQNRGAFADASFEHAVDVFVKAATGGQWESAKATSASIFFGDRGYFGTGSFKVALNIQAIREIEEAATKEGKYTIDHLMSVVEDPTAIVDAVGGDIIQTGDENELTGGMLLSTPADPIAALPVKGAVIQGEIMPMPVAGELDTIPEYFVAVKPDPTSFPIVPQNMEIHFDINLRTIFAM